MAANQFCEILLTLPFYLKTGRNKSSPFSSWHIPFSAHWLYAVFCPITQLRPATDGGAHTVNVFYYLMAFTGQMFTQLPHKIHSDDKILFPFLIYFLTSMSIGHSVLQFPHSIHLFPLGAILINETRD